MILLQSQVQQHTQLQNSRLTLTLNYFFLLAIRFDHHVTIIDYDNIFDKFFILSNYDKITFSLIIISY